jgi:predicted metal-dependent hydrolase
MTDPRIVYQRSPRARRLSLRVDPKVGGIVVVMPNRASEAAAERFVARHAGWVLRQLARLPTPKPFADGATLPLLGREVTLRHLPGSRLGVRLEGDSLLVAGEAEHVARRVRDFLKALARREFASRAHALAARVGRRPTRISVRDGTSRWGSCTAAGALSFSWRLILAPVWVLDYVVAHEVAHLVHLDHSPRFWKLVDELTPDVERARDWLSRHGAALHVYG